MNLEAKKQSCICGARARALNITLAIACATGSITRAYCRQLGCEHCNIKASGNLLPALALLDQLQELHLDRNWINGTLPPTFAYGFPALVKMRLDFNSLTVSAHWHIARLAQ